MSQADGAGPSEFDDTWVVEYDPGRPGRSPSGQELIAHLVVTKNRDEAAVYSLDELLEVWLKYGDLRPDGLPNRPLTAFHIEVDRDYNWPPNEEGRA